MAALVDIGVFDRLRKLDEEFETQWRNLRGKLAEAFSDYSEAEVDALVNEAVVAARANSGSE